MKNQITGIHHITALAGDSRQNLDFYTGILGMRLVKKTVNFDAPEVYHLYYGDETGSPGTILTFFPYEGIRRGSRGDGLVNSTTFSVPISSIGFWENRLRRFGVPGKKARERMGNEVFLYFEDPDGLGLELVFNERDTRPGFSYGHIPLEHSIRGFYSAEIWAGGVEPTAAMLTGQMDHVLIAEQGNRFRFAAADSPGNYLDIVVPDTRNGGMSGAGTVHHLAFNTPDEESQLVIREGILQRIVNTSPVIDRHYFKSFYFREPSGVLFEVATEIPGFAIDEPVSELGGSLMLPPRYEGSRQQIELGLKPLSLNLEAYQ
ncbi:MAG: VOC family protein [Bacteroidales bacterium]